MKDLCIGLVGARGHVGAELIRLVAAHPRFDLAYVSSRALAGRCVAEHVQGYRGGLRYTSPAYEELPELGADAVVLALPNGKAGHIVRQFDDAGADAVILDLSADYRFDPAWYYGLPELTRANYRGQRRISNPGCYATAMQLAIAPMLDVLDGPVQCFGVSGHSGAGTTPSDKNDPDALRDNLIPYALTGHVHEREVSKHLARPFALDEVQARYRARYAGDPLVRVVEGEAPWVSRIAGAHHVEIGGFTLSADGRRLVVVANEDILLKGAATQAMQNLNLAFGLDEFAGIPIDG
jgi:N-acetyl-gamma-glutamyl-phosphate reductase